MKYRNRRNGLIIDIPCELKGNEWELVETSAPAFVSEEKEETEPKKIKKVAKKATE